MHKARWLGFTFNVFGNALVLLNLLCGYEAVKDPYAWPMYKNALFNGFTRISYAVAILLVFASVVLGHFEIGRIVCSNSYMRGLGKLTYSGALLCPIVITLAYCSQDYSMYLTIPGVMYLGIGNIISELIVCFFVYLSIEYPLKNLVGLTLLKKISHDEVLREKHILILK